MIEVIRSTNLYRRWENRGFQAKLVVVGPTKPRPWPSVAVRGRP